MKKIILATLFWGIFAGISLPVWADSSEDLMETGISTSGCNQVLVKLISEDNKRIWKLCDDSKNDCVLRSCVFNSKEPDKWDENQCNKYCVSFQEAIPLGKDEIRSISGDSGVELALNYVSLIYKFGAYALGFVAVLVIVVSGVQIIAGGADENGISAAKERILQALLSLALLFSSALILKTINPDFFV